MRKRKTKRQVKPAVKSKDPFFALRYIAYMRTGFPVNEEDLDDDALCAFAKWQICKVRNVLWLDPIWDQYTAQEILIEYFSIRFDESDDLRQTFEKGIVQAKKSDIDWFERKTREHHAKIQAEAGIIKEVNSAEEPTVPQDFEDNFQ